MHFVFDELQDALMVSSSRFTAPFSLVSCLRKTATGSGIILSGCMELLTLRQESMFRPFLNKLEVVKHKNLSKLLTHKPKDVEDKRGLITTFREIYLEEHFDKEKNVVIVPTALKAMRGLNISIEELERVEQTHPIFLIPAANFVRGNNGRYIMMCNRKDKALSIELYILICTTLLYYAQVYPAPIANKENELEMWHFKDSTRLYSSGDRVVLLSVTTESSSEMIEHVIGRVDMVQTGRYVYVKQPKGAVASWTASGRTTGRYRTC